MTSLSQKTLPCAEKTSLDKNKKAETQRKLLIDDILRLREIYHPSIEGPRRGWDHEEGPDDLEYCCTLVEEIEHRAGLLPCDIRSRLRRFRI